MSFTRPLPQAVLTRHMHELSIAISIIDTAAAEAARHGAAQVNAVHLKLGALSGVVKDALIFSYELACNGTALEGSELIIEETPIVVLCTSCQAERVIESIQSFCCPVCGTLTPEVIRGRELEVFAMEIEQ